MSENKSVLYQNINRPLYLQLKDFLVEQIDDGELAPGDALPGERILAEKYDISRVTVRKCIGQMVEEGYLIRSQGKDTRVADRKINHRLGVLAGVIEELSVSNREITVKAVQKGYIDPSTKVRDALNLAEGDMAYGFKLAVYTEKKPLMLNYSYVPMEIGKLLENLDVEKVQIFPYLERCGYRFSYGEQQITAGLCRADEGELLECTKGSAVLVVKRVTYLDTGDPILFERSVYRSDAYQYSVKLYRKQPDDGR